LLILRDVAFKPGQVAFDLETVWLNGPLIVVEGGSEPTLKVVVQLVDLPLLIS
jgi:hypothetical protein